MKNMIDKIKSLMKGKKTYTVAGLMFLLWVANHLGYIDTATYNAIKDFLIACGVVTIRDGIKSEKK